VLPSADGATFDLGESLKKHERVVVVFYRGAW